MLEMLNSRKIDLASYRNACDSAISDLAKVFAPLQEVSKEPNDVYFEFLPTRVNIPPIALVASGVRNLITKIARHHGFERTNVLRRARRSLDGYVSWLIVNTAKRELTIIYDDMKLANIFPLDEIKKVSGATGETDDATRLRILNSGAYTYACEKVLGKILLHEIGHASLHKNRYDHLTPYQDGRVEMPPECEAEAWVYAHTAWGILVGDDSYAARMSRGKDEGYLRS